MASPSYTQYRGAGALLPAGFQETLTLPGQHLARGIENLTNILDRKREREKQEQLADKAAIAMYDAFQPGKSESGGEQPHPFGIGRDELLSLDRRSRIGTIKGYYDGMVLKQAMAQQEQMGRVRQAQLGAAMSERGSNEALQRVVQNTGQMDPAEALALGRGPIQPPAVTPSPERFMQQLSRNPQAVNSPNFDTALRLQQAMQQANVMPVQKSFGGRDFLINPRTGSVEADLTARPTNPIPQGFIALGATVDDEGKVNVRFGPSPADVAKAPTAADQAFFTNAQELQAKLDDLDATIKKHGNWESALGDPETKAKLLQYPYAIAINYAKIVDPSSVAREGEVAAAQKYMIPMGFWTRNDLSRAAIKTMREELTRRVKAYNGVKTAPAGGAQASPESGSILDDETALKILQEAGFDKEKARQMARTRGFKL